MRPLAFEESIGEADETAVRHGGVGGAAQCQSNRLLGCLGVERAQSDKRRGGRAAEAGIAMDEQRSLAVPAAHELDELADVLLGRCRGALLHLDDVVHVELQVPLDGEAGGVGGTRSALMALTR